jgi:arylsulfatase A-like enzyme
VNDQHVAAIVDVAPTLLGLLGMETPDHMHGRDLSPILHGLRPALDDPAGYIECTSGAIGIRTPTHAYGVNIKNDLAPWGLYDLTTDPYQQDSLIDSPALAPLQATLHSDLLDWHHRTPVRHADRE